MCAHVNTHVCALTYAHVSICVCVSQRSILGVISQKVLSTLFFCGASLLFWCLAIYLETEISDCLEAS